MEKSETEETRGARFNLALIGIFILVVFLLYGIGNSLVHWNQTIAAQRAEMLSSWKCDHAGGKYRWADYDGKEGKVCLKEYQSCGPDESRPGFTVCEQKFKRINP